jgi:two-component system, sensor histidine kinase and response regulator
MERILIVEDSATQREMLRHTLEHAGYEVLAAQDGRDAWERLEQLAPTIVVTDIIMPRMDGYELCRTIKAAPRFARIPVVLLTSLSDPKDVIAALECGADGFIGKPFADDYLLSRVRGVIENRDLPERDKRERGVEISHEGRRYLINAERQQILDLLLSVYEVATRRNADLAQAQASLRKLNSELEQKVRDRTRKLEESNQSLETFCYSVAHDLRAPLRSVEGYMAIVAEMSGARQSEEVWAYIERARAAAVRMDKMIVDLLAYGRVSHSDAPLEWVELKPQLEHSVAEFAPEIAAKQARVEVESVEARLWTSRVLLGQILHNLIGNALKFVRAGERPDVRIEATLKDGNVRIAVRDHGIGIDLAYRSKIFKVFEKLHSQPFPGTGIGLAIVQKAVERLGGRVDVESQVNKGSCFAVELPMAAPSADGV